MIEGVTGAATFVGVVMVGGALVTRTVGVTAEGGVKVSALV